MGRSLKIRDDLSSEALRRAARREKDGRAAARMYAIANALDGLSRAESDRNVRENYLYYHDCNCKK